MTDRMLVFCSWNNETVVEREVEDLGCGAGSTVCLECAGHGDASQIWGPEVLEFTGSTKCIECKGTGRQLVSI
jgi:DnaJ-class molecular chaperone